MPIWGIEIPGRQRYRPDGEATQDMVVSQIREDTTDWSGIEGVAKKDGDVIIAVLV
jgi:hypothetical protein